MTINWAISCRSIKQIIIDTSTKCASYFVMVYDIRVLFLNINSYSPFIGIWEFSTTIKLLKSLWLRVKKKKKWKLKQTHLLSTILFKDKKLKIIKYLVINIMLFYLGQVIC